MKSCFAFIPVFLSAHLAQATILYDQSTGATNNGWYSDATLPNPQSLGDDFLVTATWDVESIQWLGVYENSTAFADSFLVNVWTTNGAGLPVSPLAFNPGTVARLATGQQTSWGWDIYQYTLPLNAPLSLNPGTFVLEIQNNTPASQRNWAWLTSAGPRFYYHREGTWYQGDAGTLKFKIEGSVVPEPSSAMLLTLAVLGLFSRSRKHWVQLN